MKGQKQTIQFKNIIKELGLDNLSVEEQKKLLEEMAEIVYKKILLRIVNRLSDEEIAELNNFLDKKDFEKINKYIENKIPDFIEIFKQEIETFQEKIIKSNKKAVIEQVEE